MSYISDHDLKLTVKELLKSFDEKVEKLNEARVVFAEFDVDIQLALLQNNNPALLNAVKPSPSTQQSFDPCYLTLSNVYWCKLYNFAVLKLDTSSDLKTIFFNKYCLGNSPSFTKAIVRDALKNLNTHESEKDLINKLATQVSIYDSIFSFKFSASPIRTKIYGAKTTVKAKINSCFEMIRTFEQIAPKIDLEICKDDSLLKIEDNQFDDAIKYLDQDLRYNRGEFFKVNDHLEIQLSQNNLNIYVRFSEVAATKLNQLYGR